ncbi:MAG: type IV toxin-antitoxin system AbiEi family antitoxin domain-containing protein [Candidatus Dojkabacteria bacterium]
MKYIDIQNNLRNLGVFTLNDIRILDPDFREPTLNDWLNSGWIKRIRRFWYADSSFDPQGNDYFFIANKIYSPSYISLESALSHYGFIPETTLQITSVSTRKTNLFDTQYGVFSYQSIKNNLYFGYEVIENNDRPFTLATPEKAILDYLYLHSEISSMEDFEGLRFNTEIINSTIDKEKFDTYLNQFDNLELNNRANILLEYLNA